MSKVGSVLFADDCETLREFVKIILNEEIPEYNIETFESGEKLLSRLEKNIEDVKLVIVDNQMPPGISGIDIIKYHKYKGKIPFILYTSDDNGIGEEAVKHNASYVKKSSDETELLTIVKEALNAIGKRQFL